MFITPSFLVRLTKYSFPVNTGDGLLANGSNFIVDTTLALGEVILLTTPMI
jgi:hypothetical protein